MKKVRIKFKDKFFKRRVPVLYNEDYEYFADKIDFSPLELLDVEKFDDAYSLEQLLDSAIYGDDLHVPYEDPVTDCGFDIVFTQFSDVTFTEFKRDDGPYILKFIYSNCCGKMYQITVYKDL
jgi:hypothetical protein